MWARLHGIADNPGVWDSQAAAKFFEAWFQGIPCPECSDHAGRIIAEIGQPPLDSADTFFKWTVIFHDAVNVWLEKPEFGIDWAQHARECRMSTAARCGICAGCGNFRKATAVCGPSCGFDGKALKPRWSTAVAGGCPEGKWPDAPPPDKNRVLITFPHGLGDCVQLTAVLAHLEIHQPDWRVTVAVDAGKAGIFKGQCETLNMVPESIPPFFGRVFNLAWPEHRDCYTDIPGTKTTKCLREVFGIEPDMALLKYRINVPDAANETARAWLSSIAAMDGRGKFKAVAIHYQGSTSPQKKNLSHETIAVVCNRLISAGYTPVILDWNNQSPLPDGRTIHCPKETIFDGRKTGEASMIAALISNCAAFVGVDSGPLHVAGATTTPAIAAWTRHQPVQFFDPCENTVHLVPANWREQFPATMPGVAAVQERFYALREYNDAATGILQQLAGFGLSLPQPDHGAYCGVLRATEFGRDYYEEHRAAGLDYLAYGDWQKNYGRWFVGALGLHGKAVLDAGCACGAMVRAFIEAGADSTGVDVNGHMIALGHAQWPELAEKTRCCDIASMPHADASVDVVHCMQSAEHWNPESVRSILSEIIRVLKPGGFMWCALDTIELYERQGRRVENEDPTHLCVKPVRWWLDALRELGLEDISATVARNLSGYPGGFLERYQWDWFAFRKPCGLTP